MAVTLGCSGPINILFGRNNHENREKELKNSGP